MPWLTNLACDIYSVNFFYLGQLDVLAGTDGVCVLVLRGADWSERRYASFPFASSSPPPSQQLLIVYVVARTELSFLRLPQQLQPCWVLQRSRCAFQRAGLPAYSTCLLIQIENSYQNSLYLCCPCVERLWTCVKSHGCLLIAFVVQKPVFHLLQWLRYQWHIRQLWGESIMTPIGRQHGI